MRLVVSTFFVVALGSLVAATHGCADDDCTVTLTCERPPAGGAGGAGGATTSATGGGGAAQQCDEPSDCDGELTECEDAFDCVDNMCTKLNKAAGEPCNQGLQICSGQGFCGDCVADEARCIDDTNTVEVCTPEGSWQTAPSACSGATPVCSAGACQALSQLALGADHHCALLANGTIRCWGDNTFGQLGEGVLGAAKTIPVEVITIDDAVEVGSDYDLTCALRADASVWCWGKMTVHNDIVDDSVSWLTPTQIATGVSAFAVGGNRICVLHTDGVVECMGDSFIEIGDGDAHYEFDPANSGSGGVSELGTVGMSTGRELSLGLDSLCVLSTDDQVYCAGDQNAVRNSLLTENQIDLATAPNPPTVTSDHHIAGGSRVTCIGTTTQDGSTLCFGSGSDWQENGANYGSATMRGVAVGYNHFCAIDSEQVVCFGACNNGQCGTLENIFLHTVTPVLAEASQVWAGGNTTCAKKTNGSVVCWGDVKQGATPGPVPVALQWIP